MYRRLVYIYLLNVPSFSSRYFNKIKTNVSFREIVRLIARNSLKDKTSVKSKGKLLKIVTVAYMHTYMHNVFSTNGELSYKSNKYA